MAEESTPRPNPKIHINVDTAQAVEFVRLLAEDDAFRARLTRDPKAVLWEYGVQVSAEFLPKAVRLPSKAAVREQVDTIRRSGELKGRPGPQTFFPIFTCFFVFPFAQGKIRR
jgi:hypothetical protein